MSIYRCHTEDNRNRDHAELWEAMIKCAYPEVTGVGCGHHIMFKRPDRIAPDEYPSADCLIFDHEVARAIWGHDYKFTLSRLAMEPPETRDVMVRKLFEEAKAK